MIDYCWKYALTCDAITRRLGPDLNHIEEFESSSAQYTF